MFIRIYPLQETYAQLKCEEIRIPGSCRLTITNVGKPLQDFHIFCEEGSRYGNYTKPHLPLSIECFKWNSSLLLETFLTTGMKDNYLILCWHEDGIEKYAFIQPRL